MVSTQKKFGLRVRELRKASKHTQEKLAEKLEIDVRSLRKIESGESFLSVRTLENLAKVLNISFPKLFEFEHLQPKDDLKFEIIKMLDENPERLQDIYKIIKVLTS